MQQILLSQIDVLGAALNGPELHNLEAETRSDLEGTRTA
jgi:hypothetical protein